ncbi:MAG: PDZ domain-containing protein [Mangrovibacterium sp.]
MRFVIFITLAVLVSISFVGNANINIYVSTTGNDNNPGTKKKPVQSFAKARELAQQFAGKKAVTVTFANGIYYLPESVRFIAKDNGNAGLPVVYRAAERGQAVLSGGSRLKLDWKPYKNGIYKASVHEDVKIDQLYVDGKWQRMARFPNAVPGKNVFDTWDLKHTSEPDSVNDPLSKERTARWKDPKGGYIHVMHEYLWGDMHWMIKGKRSDGSLDYEGGWQNNRPSKMHPRYRMVENIFEELDVPGEWYYNSNEKTLYYYPTANVDLSNATIEVVRLKHLVEFSGSKAGPVRFIMLEGFTFRHAARTFMENREPLLRSDWTTYRGGAVFFDGAEDCTLLECEFDQPGGNSIFVNNYNRRILVKSCYIHEGGANGVAFVGDPDMVRSPLFRYGKQNFNEIDRTPGPKGSNYPEACRVEDCIITLTGRVEKQTAGVQISMSHAITVSHCSVYDVPRAGINISEGTFGGHVIENCDVFNTVLETGDHGSFNSWGRDRFWTPDIKETSEEVIKDPALPRLDMLGPNVIRNSRWRCDHGWDIDLDDGSTWYLIYNNVLLNGGLKLREGYAREATNNVIINNSLHPHVWYVNSSDVFEHNIVFGAYRPALMQRDITPEGKWGARIDSNLFATNEADRMKFAANGTDLNSMVGDPMFADPQHGDYQAKNGSPALRIGFKNFPMDAFGVVSPWLRKIAKTPGMPELMTAQMESPGQTFQWQGGTVKNVETEGEQSAAGLSEINGVLVMEVPGGSVLAQSGLKVGDVILECQGQKISTFSQLLQVVKDFQYVSELKLLVRHNQSKETIIIKTH